MGRELSDVQISIVKAIKFLAWLAVLLVALSSAIRLYGHFTGSHPIRKFDLDSENSLPTFVSTILLFLCCGSLTVISLIKHRTRAPFWKHWIALAFILGMMSMDEMTSIHEPFGPVFRKLGATGLFYFAWVIPGIVFVALFTFAYWRFLAHLRTDHRKRFVLSGFLFVMGAIGLELLGGRHAEQYGFHTLTYVALFTLEESFEFAGVICLLYTTLTYLSELRNPFTVEIGSSAEVNSEPVEKRPIAA